MESSADNEPARSPMLLAGTMSRYRARKLPLRTNARRTTLSNA